MGEEHCQAAQALAEEEKEDTGSKNKDESDAQKDRKNGTHLQKCLWCGC